MRRLPRPLAYSVILALSTCGLSSAALAGEPPPALTPTPAPLVAPQTAPLQTAWSTAVTAKPLSNNVLRGLEFLAKHQLADGGWGQGEESANMGASMNGLAERSNVADTCVTLLALMRAGSTPREGVHAAALTRGLEFVLGKIEQSDADSLSITDVNGTRVQGKLGVHVDTFMASLALAEAKGLMPDAGREARLEKGLTKVLRKIEINQQADGGFESQGWAPVLAQAVAGKGINRAAQKGAVVSGESRKKFEDWANRQYDAKANRFEGEGSAGVNLYAAAATVGTLEESKNTRSMERADAEKKLADKRPMSVAENAKAQQVIVESANVDIAAGNAQQGVLKQLEDPSFVAGFGSNGGEEFLSYMLLAESLVAKGGNAWSDWDKAMTANLNRVQNGDGSWTGHHCITGRNFVTAAALLVLTADRAQVPLAAKIKQG
jgi:hypothetical protein